MVNGNILNSLDAKKEKIYTKTLDFYAEFDNKKIYTTTKYIKDKGGAQDNQYNDILSFLSNAMLNKDSNNYFIAIVDGKYFNNNKMSRLENYQSNNIFISHSNENLFKVLKCIKYESNFKNRN